VLADYRPAHSSYRFLPVGPDTIERPEWFIQEYGITNSCLSIGSKMA
jgi:hypothetical protein